MALRAEAAAGSLRPCKYRHQKPRTYEGNREKSREDQHIERHHLNTFIALDFLSGEQFTLEFL
jgi:hypothetical protein